MITIYELKRRNEANGGKFFNRLIMKAWGDTLKNFRVSRDVDPFQVVVTRLHETSKGAKPKSWRFVSETGRLVSPLRA